MKYDGAVNAVLTNLNATVAATTPLLADDGQPFVISYDYDVMGRLRYYYDAYKHDVNGGDH